MEKITIEALVYAPLSKVWACWTAPEHIVHWNFASDDWHTPKAENDLRVGGTFVYTMAARDESFSFDFSGTFLEILEYQRIAIFLGDGRSMEITFAEEEDAVKVVEIFDAETENPVEMQRTGWQMILNNFKKYVEGV